MKADDTSLASPPLHAPPTNEPGRRYTMSLNDRQTSTPRNQMPAAPNPKRESLLQTSISALSKLASASNTTNDGSTSLQVDDDELLHLDLEEALYTGGKPDAFSPAAYKNLQMNAVGLLLKLHNAYRSRTAALKVAEAERDTQKDDLIDARTRAIQLKQQVENMQRQAAEHERSMMELMNELAAEKRARISEGEEREKALVVPCIPEVTGEGSISEDLGVDEAQQMRKWRKSAVTIRSDMSYDSDGDSVEGESIFSRSRSPTLLSVAPSIAPSETTSPAQSRPPNLGLPRSRTPLPMSAFSKVWKGITKVVEEGCRCRGRDSSVAWDTVNLLKSENKALKERVGELEDVVEGVLDVVNGVGI